MIKAAAKNTVIGGFHVDGGRFSVILQMSWV